MSTVGREKRKEYEPFASECIRGEIPACSAACPLNLDVRQIAKHLQAGKFDAAYRAYLVEAVFPEIVAAICDEPCKAGCVREDLDESLSLRLLEKSCVDLARTKRIPSFNLPPKPQKTAVIGAGLSGLTCAVKLAARGFPVTIFEKSDRLGGRLWDLLDPEIFLPSIQAQLDATKLEVRFNSEVTSLDELDYDAIVVATGQGGETFGLLEGVDRQGFGTTRAGVFLVGDALGTTPVEDIGQGRVAAFSVEKYLRIAAMDGTPDTFTKTESKIPADLSTVEAQAAVVPKEPTGFDEDEAKAEAGRCLLCDCSLCADSCELFGWSRKMPRQMVADQMAALHTARSGGAMRVMVSCNLCGLCGEVCPVDIDMGHFYRDFRVFKREDNQLPLPFYDYFLHDMQHADEEGYLALPAPGYETAGYVFFPGCQLGASDPRHVELTYHHLLERIPDMGLILGCCGAPAEWGADTTLRDEVTEKLEAEWERLGRPKFVFACATCRLQFQRRLPEIQSVSLYELLLEIGLPEVATPSPDLPAGSWLEAETVALVEPPAEAVDADAADADAPADTAAGREACIFDPCSSRGDDPMQQAVRRLAEGAGFRLTELPYSGEKAQCCGWGGHIDVANPELASTIAENRSKASSLPYITYCANCQEVFSRSGKGSQHILDLVLGLDKSDKRLPSLGQRRLNRMATKQAVLQREWGIDMTETTDATGPELDVTIPDDLLARMYKDRIVEDNVYKVIEHSETTDEVVYDPGRDLFIGHLRIGLITYWVEYAKTDEGIVVHDVFSHRLEILDREGAV